MSLTSGADVFATGCAVSVALIGAVTDARTGRIPNKLTHAALLGAPIASLVFGYVRGGAPGALGAAGASLLGAVVCGAFPVFLFAKRGLGGGDVKLFAAVGALLGWRAGLDAQCIAMLAAAAFVMARFAWRGRLSAVLRGWASSAIRLPGRTRPDAPAELKQTMRLGPAIFAGTAAAVLFRALSVRGFA